MCSDSRPDSRQLIVLSSVLAVMLSQGKTTGEISHMAAFFTLLGDTLALLALQEEETTFCPPDC